MICTFYSNISLNLCSTPCVLKASYDFLPTTSMYRGTEKGFSPNSFFVIFHITFTRIANDITAMTA